MKNLTVVKNLIMTGFLLMMKTMKYLYLFVFVASAQILACSQPAENKKQCIENTENKIAKVYNTYYNNFARTIAGMMPDTSSLFNGIVSKPSWKNYSMGADSAWRKVYEKNLKKIKLWVDMELVEYNKPGITVFYPFSGPDFLYANTFFPNAAAYIMFGLERPGSVPDISRMNEIARTQYYSSVNQSLEDILNLSFFKTIKMSSQLNNASVDGVLPLLLLFMARTGNIITDVNSAYIDNTGEVVVNDTLFPVSSRSRFGKGVEVCFVKSISDTLVRKVYYFSADLTEQGLEKNYPVKLYLQKLDSGVVTFLKSASYLLHNNLFAFVRKTILDKSRAVLQDDSGIAYHFFNKKDWSFNYYGIYDKPIEVFSYCFQKDLNAEYNKGSKSFNFKYGYGKGRNMLLAKSRTNQ